MARVLRPKFILFQAGFPCQWTTDSQRFILEYFDVIINSPSFIYSYAILFSPSSSWLHHYYNSEPLYGIRMIKGLLGWGKCSRIVSSVEKPKALACWKNIIAVSSGSDIAVLDAITGSQIAVHSGHADSVKSLTCSPDGTSLVSGSKDTTIKLWDIQTGGIVNTFHGHTRVVNSVSISADCTTIASGSDDCTLCLWNIQTGKCYTINQAAPVLEVHFFPLNSKQLVSVSDAKVWWWNTNGRKIAPAYNGHCVTFSFDGTKLAFVNSGVVQVQTSDSGVIVAQFRIPHSFARDCCFSPDGRLIAVGVFSTVYVWNITSPDPFIVETFINTPKSENIASLRFASLNSLITASGFGLLRFWQVHTLSTAPDMPNSSIQSITLQAKDGIAISSDSDGVVKIRDLSTGLCNASYQTPAKGSSRRDIRLIENSLILVWHTAKEISIWDVGKEELLKTVAIDDEDVCELRISEDGSTVFYKFLFSLEAIDTQTGHVVGKVKLEENQIMNAFLGVDGSTVWMRSTKNNMWNFRISDSSSLGSCLASLSRYHLDFVGGIRMDRTVLPPIEDTITGRKFLQLPKKLDNPTDAQWDGQYLVAGYDTGEVLILECSCALSH